MSDPRDEATRESLCEAAQKSAEQLDAQAPGNRVVVVVTDASGDWVGVGSNTHHEDVLAILRCALTGDDFRFHGRSTQRKGVIMEHEFQKPQCAVPGCTLDYAHSIEEHRREPLEADSKTHDIFCFGHDTKPNGRALVSNAVCRIAVARNENGRAQAIRFALDRGYEFDCITAIVGFEGVAEVTHRLDATLREENARELLEALSAQEHDRWSGWEKYRERVDDPDARVRWKRQRETPYSQLSERERESDRDEARKTLSLLRRMGVIE